MADALDAWRRASMLSNSSKVKEEKLREINKSDPPPDRFYLLHLLFLVFGLSSLLPITFFITSNQYWMYKFRDIHNDSKRTFLQANFAPVSMAAQTIPGLLITYFAMRYGHRWKLRTRVLAVFTFVIGCFLLSTTFIKIDTDTWQLGFFVFTMVTLTLISITMPVLNLTVMVLTSKFPQEFVKIYTLGHGMTGLFSAVLQIIAITFGKNPTQTALIYFLSGTLVLCASTVLFYVSKNLKLYRYYMNVTVEDTKRDPYTWNELKPVMWKMMPAIINVFTFMPTIFMFHPNLTSLVRSEFYSNGSAWSRKYFVPVITFLYSDIASLVGRIVATPILSAKNGWIFNIVCVLRMVLIAPLLCFCNIETPTKHLPVVFNHDWEFIIILGIFVFLNGYLLTVSYISVPNLVGMDVEKAYTLLQASMTLASCMSPLGVVLVNTV